MRYPTLSAFQPRTAALAAIIGLLLCGSGWHARASDAAASLKGLYRSYMIVKTCNDLDYLDDGQLNTARKAIRAKQDYLTRLQSVDTKAVWLEAGKSIGGMLQMLQIGATEYNESMANLCSDAFAAVTWPGNGYEPGGVEKDF